MGRGSEEELESRDWDGKGSVERRGELGLRGGEGDLRSLVGRDEAMPAGLGMGALVYNVSALYHPGREDRTVEGRALQSLRDLDLSEPPFLQL